MTIHFPSFCSYPWTLKVVFIWHLADGSHCHEHLLRWPPWWAVRPAASGASVGAEVASDSGHWPPAIHSGNLSTPIVHNNGHFSRNQLGGGHHPIILCWILADNFDDTRYWEKLTASGSGQCSVQWQHSVSLISATRPPRVTSGGPEEAVLGFVGHTYYQP